MKNLSEEKKLEAEIKKMAKQGNKEACGVLAKQLVNLRKQKTRSYAAGAKMNSIQGLKDFKVKNVSSLRLNRFIFHFSSNKNNAYKYKNGSKHGKDYKDNASNK